MDLLSSVFFNINFFVLILYDADPPEPARERAPPCGHAGTSWSKHIFFYRGVFFFFGEFFCHNFVENDPQDLKMVQKDASRNSTQSVIKISS
jgi:hypothetical protein